MPPTETVERREQQAGHNAPSTGQLPHESRQSALVAIGRRAVAAADVTLLMQDAAALVAETLDADFSSVAELASGGATFEVRLCSAKGGAPLSFSTPAGAHESLAGRALESGHPVLSADLRAESRLFDAALARHGVRSVVVCPLKLDNRGFGALGVYHSQPNRFTPADILFLETISHLITTTIARERTERQFAAERSFAATLLETVEALVLVLTPAGRLIRLNRAAEKITGFLSDEVWERPVFAALVVPEEMELMKSVLERLQRGQSPLAFDSSILTKHGDRRKISWSYSIQRDSHGKISALVGTGIDITDKCAAESLLAEAREQAEKLTCELDAARLHIADASGSPAAGLRPFQQLKESGAAERREKPRRAYPYVQLIAPMKGHKLPARNAFVEVLCHDISASGFSFFADCPPASEQLCVAFGTGAPLTYLKAQVIHCTRTADGSKFLIGCHYTERVQT